MTRWLKQIEDVVAGRRQHALRTGKWPRKMGLLLSNGEDHWELTLQGDQLTVSAARLPDIDNAQTDREIVEQRLALIVGLATLLDALYSAFLRERASRSWPGITQQIREWIANRRKDAHVAGTR